MRRDKIISGVIAWSLAVVTALAGIGCIASGFDLSVTEQWGQIHLFCVIFAAVAAVCCSFRWGAPVMAALSLTALVLFCEEAALSVSALVYRISCIFDTAYGWGILYPDILLEHPLMSPHPSTAVALMIIGCLVISAICWTICRRRWVGFGLLAGLAPLVLCCVVTDTVPDAPYLSFLIGALLILALTQLVRRRDIRSGNRVTAIVLVPVLVLSIVLPPYAQATDLQQQAQQLQDALLQWIGLEHEQPTEPPSTSVTPPPGIGITESIDLHEIGPMSPSTNMAMTIDTHYRGLLYLRGAAYDAYTGTGWSADADTTGEGGWPYLGLAYAGTVTITPNGTIPDMRYFPYYIQSPQWTQLLINGVLADDSQQPSYTFAIFEPTAYPHHTPLADAGPYLALPRSTQQRAARILDEFLGDAELTDTQKAAHIADYVRSSADYDLMTEKMPEDQLDFALWFLEESATGYCVHFASAATVLLRAAGIPARYVTGYLTYSAGDGISGVTADEAHAWVEYLDPKLGWTVLEATPGAVERIEPPAPTETTEPPTEQTDSTEPSEETTLPSEETTPPTQQTTGPTADTTAPTGTTPGGSGTSEVKLVWIWYVLWVLLAWVVLALQHRLRRLLRIKWLMKGDEKQRALRRWRYVRRAVRMLKLPYPEHLQALAEKAVFSQHTLTAEELEQFDLWLKNAKRYLLTKPWPIRLTMWFLFSL